MQQDATQPATADVTAAPATNSDAAALQQMGFSHLLQNFDPLGMTVFVVLFAMSIGSWFYNVINMIRNVRIVASMNRVIGTFWETSSAADAVRYMEGQPKGEPFSKIALECA